MDVVNETSLAAFIDELQVMEKEAGVMDAVGKYVRPGVLFERLSKMPSSWGRGARRFVEQLHPVKGTKRALRWASPSTNPEMQSQLRVNMLKEYGAKVPQKMKKTVFGANKEKAVDLTAAQIQKRGLLPSRAETLRQVEHAKGELGPREGPGLLSRYFGTASKEHLLRPNQAITEIIKGPGTSGEKVKAIAEQLSRSGWTGGGRVTKYLPLGTKGVITGFTAAEIPSIAQAAQQGSVGPTGEGGAFERGLGTAGGAAGWLMGMPLGFLGSSGMWYGGEEAGKNVGRVIDRLRGGASLGTALTAPSPTEAREQLVNIAQNYG